MWASGYHISSIISRSNFFSSKEECRDRKKKKVVKNLSEFRKQFKQKRWTNERIKPGFKSFEASRD